MKNTVKINEVSRKEMVKNYINVESNGKNYLVTTNAENKVRYISKCIEDSSYYRGVKLEPVHTNSIKSVFGITKTEFNEKVEECKVNQEKLELILEQQCELAESCESCKILKFCHNCNLDYDLIYKNEDEILNIGVEEIYSVSVLDDISSIDFFGNCEVNERFAVQWDKVIKSSVEQKEIIIFENQSFGLNVIAKCGLDTYILPLNEPMMEFDRNYLLNEFTNIVNDLYNLKAKYKKIDTTVRERALPF